jgi:hypothetical protein
LFKETTDAFNLYIHDYIFFIIRLLILAGDSHLDSCLTADQHTFADAYGNARAVRYAHSHLHAHRSANAHSRTKDMMTGKDAKYTVGYDKDGKIILTDKKGTLVYWDGKYNSKVITKLIDATGDCEGTVYPPASSTANWANLDVNQKLLDLVIIPMANKADDMPFFSYESQLTGKVQMLPVPFRNNTNCWGELFYQDKPIPRVDFVWKRLNKTVENVEVFELKK